MRAMDAGQKLEILRNVECGALSVEEGIARLRALVRNPPERPTSLLYACTWARAEIPGEPVPAAVGGTWLVLGEPSERYDAIAGALQGDVITVRWGSGFQANGPKSFVVDPSNEEHMQRLLRALLSEGSLPSRVLHVGGEMRDLFGIFLLSKSAFVLAPRHALVLVSLQRAGSSAWPFALAGYLGVATLENPSLRAKVVFVDGSFSASRTCAIALAEMASFGPGEREVHYDGDGRRVRVLRELADGLEAHAMKPLREGGVYLVTGGAGGIGRQIAERLVRTARAKVVLLGRSRSSDAHAKLVADLRRLGGDALYLQADVTLREDVENAVQRAREHFGAVHGVIHAAGVVDPAFVVRKSFSSFKRVVAPKTLGALHLDDATSRDSLDFFVLFSSIGATVLSNPAQSDYAAANHFLDGFAEDRNARVAQRLRSGHTVSINWPLWKDGGMSLSAEEQEALFGRHGMTALGVDEGFDALLRSLRANVSQVFVLHGERAKIEPLLEAQRSAPPALAASSPPRASRAEQLEQVEAYLLEIIARESKVPKHRIDVKQGLDSIGINSLLILRLNTVLEEIFGPISKTLLYEYQSVRDLAVYFIGYHAETLARLLGTPAERPEPAEPCKSDDVVGATSVVMSQGEEDIAIIGLFGRYPGAPDLQQFWRNLREGTSSVGRIPNERWDYEQYPGLEPELVHGQSAKWGGFIEDIDKFDPLFFNIAPRDALLMDPQERLFLEAAWSAVEDAGYSREELHRTTRRGDEHAVGVFVGVTFGQYQMIGAEEWGKGNYITPNSSFWSIANRISYVMDLHGPSLPVDTACSASLTAVHMACESLRRGDCLAAIVGGVNLNVHASKYAAVHRLKFLSSRGQCSAFGEGGDGYVSGEGVGAAVLKPLRRAEADGDHIYAVIKGSSVNHGGKTNGYTVPNPNAQASLVARALERSGVHPRAITYVEAHGTGTELGDPIEITGLTKAFRAHTRDRCFCAIGSVKSNIGHLESAAGIASLTKVILQLQRKKLVATLHAEVLNPNIAFEETPFFVQRSFGDWPKPVLEQLEQAKRRTTYPRIAAVSSFGAGGANAHVIVAEYERPTSGVSPAASARPELVVLSARSPERLHAYTRKLRLAMESSGEGEGPRELADVAYTLQVGRDPLEERLAIVAGSVSELVDALRRFEENPSAQEPSWWLGRVTMNGAPVVSSHIPEQDVIAALRDRRWAEVARLWTSGVPIPWAEAHRDEPRQRVSLPSYPFERKRFWVSTTASREPRAISEPIRAELAPVEGRTVTAQTLRRSDALLRDHVVGDECVLVGVAQLEMVRTAALSRTGKAVRALRDVVWRTPVIVSESPKEIRLVLDGTGDDLAFELWSGAPDAETLHSTGRLSFSELATQPPPTIDIGAIRRAGTSSIDGEALYADYARRGLHYGPTFQRVRKLWSCGGEALAELRPAEPAHRGEDGALDPGLLDGALHAVRGLTPSTFSASNEDASEPPMVPFSVGAVRIFGHVPARCFAYAELADAPATFHLTILDEQGRAVVRFEDFTTRRLPVSRDGVDYYRPFWKESPRAGAAPVRHSGNTGIALIVTHGDDAGLGADLVALYGAERALVVSTSSDYERLLRGLGNVATIYFLGGLPGTLPSGDIARSAPHDLDALERAEEQGIMPLFRLAKALSVLHECRPRVQVVTCGTQELWGEGVTHPFAAALIGFTKVLSREFRGLDVRCVDVSAAELADPRARHALAHALREEAAGVAGEEVALRAGRRFVRSLEPVSLPATADGHLPLRRGGVYLVAGGAGGLGSSVAEHLARQYGARVALLGRSALDEVRARQLRTIEAAGGRAIYLQADLADPERVEAAVAEVRRRFGPIQGVIHSAIVLEDATIARMSERSLRDVLAPKTRGSVVLSRALAREPLDFFAFFSSAIAFTAAPGQANYAAASTFEDAFALFVRRELRLPVTIFNWGFWGDKGIVATESYRQQLDKRGVVPLREAEGLAAFEQVLASQVHQVFPMKLKPALLDELGVDRAKPLRLLPATAAPVTSDVSSALAAAVARSPKVPGGEVLEPLEAIGRLELLRALHRSGMLRVPGERIHRDAFASRMSLDSNFNRLFDAMVDVLAKADFIAVQGEYLLTSHRAASLDGRRLDDELTNQKAALRALSPDAKAFIELLGVCVPALPDVLAGRTVPTDVLFPHGSKELVENVYKGSRRTDHCNELVRKACTTFVERRLRAQPGERIAILEIGAGTGGTSAGVLEALVPFGDRVTYAYTDISPSFVAHGQRTFGARFPVAEFRVLDIEKDTSEQGLEPGSFDLVLATNVLHATRDMRRTIRGVKRLLDRSGIAVINEVTEVRDFATLTFGLTPGWWLFTDGLRLPHSPMLSLGGWQRLLEEAGFRNVCGFGMPGTDVESAGQHVIVGESDGWVEERLDQAGASPMVEAPRPERVAAPGGAPIRDEVLRFLVRTFAAVLKVDESDLETDVGFERYGVDSLVSMDILALLEQRLPPLPKTLLFEHVTLELLADALIAKHGAILAPREVAEAAPARIEPTSTANTASVVEEGIAIIGMAGRYPMADDLDAFWDNLRAGRTAFSEIPSERWDHRTYEDASGERAGTTYHPWGAFLSDIAAFDSLFFGISPREARRMDPQERVFLEAVWATLEDAGYTREALNRSAVSGGGVGVFVGSMYNGYQQLAAERWKEQPIEVSSGFGAIANRVSFVFDFHGPSLAIDTACSSALTAIHMACESIRRGECGAAIAGGVNLILHPSHHAALARVKMLSKSPVCRAFGEGADGFVSGEGVGAVLLKPLTDAVRDGDRVIGVIKGSFINTNGRTGGYSVPSPHAQADLIEAALRRAKVDPSTVSYVEAQAVGSDLGDPIEIVGLTKAFERFASAKPGCAIGTLKPNIGHLEAASGMAQVAKVLLQFRHRELAPTLVASKLNPAIDLTGTPFRIQRGATPWAIPEGGDPSLPRRALVSSFGAGGANAQLVLEEFRGVARSTFDAELHPSPELVPLSARKPEQLREQARRLAEFLARPVPAHGEPLTLADVAYTLQTGREAMAARLAIVAHDLPSLSASLARFVRDASDGPDLYTGFVKRSTKGGTGLHGGTGGSLTELAAAWVGGASVAWDRLHQSARRRVSLPTYPFVRERHWLDQEDAPVAAAPAPVAAHAVSETVVRCVAEILSLKASDVDVDEPMSDYGFDSVSLTRLAARLGAEYEIDLRPTVFYEHSTIGSLVSFLASEYADATAPRAERAAPTPSVAPMKSVEPTDDGAIAVIGMAGRFPGSPDLEAFWDNLVAGNDLITEIPEDRFDWRSIYGDPLQDSNKVRCKWGGFLRDIDQFDASFFNVSPREARVMDPQHRLFLQIAWQCIEDAGYAPESLAGTSTGVFVGIGSTEYAQKLAASGSEIDGQVATGNSHSMAANRISFLLDVHGPSEPIDTACSSSLVAVHRALSALRSGDCEMAIAGGVNLLLAPETFLAFGKSGMLAPDGRCKTFDDRADGYVRGEGVGAVLLKPLRKALADGDPIHALVRSSAVNHGGRANSLTAPNPNAQAEIVRASYERAGIAPETVGYIETHGTGTSLGDPIEINGLKKAFRQLGAGSRAERSPTAHCGLGTVKTNIGHLETAAGIAGLIKVLLAIKHRKLPPLVHFQRLNQHIDLSGSPFYIVDEARTWEPLWDARSNAHVWRAGISSFGFGGANAHVVLEAFEDERATSTAMPPGNELIVLSAKNEERVRSYARSLVEYLGRREREGGRVSLADLAWTLQVGRTAMPSRVAMVVATYEELLEKLEDIADGKVWGDVYSGDGAKRDDVLSAEGGPAAAQAYFAEQARKGNLAKLAGFWAAGADIDWKVLFDGARGRRRISLPGYPFAPERHWFPIASPTKVTTNGVHPPSNGVAFVAVEAAQPAPPAPRPVPQTDGREEVVGQIRAILAEYTGVHENALQPDREFPSYGVDSLIGLRVMQRVQQLYGDDVSMLAVFEQPTLNRLSDYIVQNHVKAPHAPAAARPAPAAPPPVAAWWDVPGAAAKGASSARVVPFRSKGTEAPLFGIYGASGEVSWLISLLEQLPKSQPVYGLEAPAWPVAAASVASMADACSEAIASIAPQGPIRLIGYGLGAVTAFEVARRLLDRGREVANLVMLDPWEPASDAVAQLAREVDDSVYALTWVMNALRYVWGARGMITREALTGDFEAQIARAASFFQQNAAGPLSGTKLVTWLKNSTIHFHAAAKAMASYRPAPLAASVPTTIVAPRRWEPGPGNPFRIAALTEYARPAEYWRPLIGEAPRVLEPSCDRFGLLSKEMLAHLREHVTSAAPEILVKRNAPRPAVVPINKEGLHVSSYWVHTLLGDISYTLPLSRQLGRAYPVYGIEQFDSDGAVHLSSDLEEMASHYARAIRESRPEGPYMLGGYSFGGIVAYEVARQLQLSGAEVSDLLLIEALMPRTEVFNSIDTSGLENDDFGVMALLMTGNSLSNMLKADYFVRLEDIAGQDRARQMQRVAEIVHARAKTKRSLPEIERMISDNYSIIMTNNDALLGYQPKPLLASVRTVLFRAMRGFIGSGNKNGMPEVPLRVNDVSNGFGAFIPNPIKVIDVDADHFTICTDEAIEALGETARVILASDTGASS